jgi:hypothetical protein
VQGVLDNLPLVVALTAGVFAPISGWLATRRSRNAALWFVFGALIGPVAPVLLAIAPPGRCPVCDAPVDGWPTACEQCGTAFGRGIPVELPVAPSRVEMATGTEVRRPAPASDEAPLEVAADPRPPSRPTRMRRPRTSSAGSGVRRTARTTVPPSVPIDRLPARHTQDFGSADLRPPRIVPPPAPPPIPARPMTDERVASRRDTRGRSGRRPAPAEGAAAGEVLSTGVYLSGNAGLEIGATYALARVDDRLRIFGPVDAGQLTVRHEGDIDDFEVTAVDDRVIIAGRSGRSSLAIIFRAIGGMRPVDLEHALSPGAGNGRAS